MNRFLFFILTLVAVSFGCGLRSQDPGGPPKVPLERGTDNVKLPEVQDLWQRRIEALRAVSGSVEAQKAIVDALQRAYQERGETIYLWNALYYQARVIHDRVQLAGDGIAILESLRLALGQVPADKAGVLLERKLVEIDAQLQTQRDRYQQAKGTERESAQQSYIELYAARKQFQTLRADLEAGDAAIRERSKVIETEIQSLTDRIERDRNARALIEARLPVLAVQEDIAKVRSVLGEIQGFSQQLDKDIPGILSLSDDVREEAMRSLNHATTPTANPNKDTK